MAKPKHAERMLVALKTGSVSTWYAANELGNLRASATIKELINKGHDISMERCKGKNRFKEDITYARYTLVKEKIND